MVEKNPNRSLDLRQKLDPSVDSSSGDFASTDRAHPSPAEATGLSPKLSGRLKVFEHMLQLANDEAGYLQEHKPAQYGIVDSEGKITRKDIDLDSHFVYTMNHTAWNMYEDELAQHPEARQSADEILKKQREPKDDGVKIMTPEQLYEPFQRE